MIGQYIKVRMLDRIKPVYTLRVVSEPVKVATHIDGIVVQYLYTCKVLWGNESVGYEELRVYLHTWDWVAEDTKHLQYWDTAPTIDGMWLNYFVEREIAQTVIDLSQENK